MDDGPEEIEISKSDGTIKIEDGASFGEATLQILVSVGSQTVISPSINVAMIDCSKQLTFIGDQFFKVGDASQLLFVLVGNNEYKTCKIERFEIEGGQKVDGVNLDKDTGILSINTKSGIAWTRYTLSAYVGDKRVVSPPIEIEVFDCRTALTFISNTTL